MAWIESHQKLEKHPKVLHLAGLLGIPLDQALGMLHRFWWWCVDYAEDGDLSKYSKETLSTSLGYDIEHLIQSKFIDVDPYLKVHDWWEYIGRFLQVKYKNYPEKLHQIHIKCKGIPKNTPKRIPKPKLPNLTIPNHTKDIKKPFAKSANDAISLKEPEKPKELTDVQKVVLVFKQASGYPPDDKGWDQLNFARCSKTAKDLITFFGNGKDAADCIQEVYERLTSKGLTVTIETVRKHAAEYKKDIQEKRRV